MSAFVTCLMRATVVCLAALADVAESHGSEPLAALPAESQSKKATEPEVAPGLRARSLYASAGRPVWVELSSADSNERRGDAAPALTIRLIDPATGLERESAELPAGPQDLGVLFPQLWSSAERGAWYAQAMVGGEALGSPLVVEAIYTRAPHADGLTVQVMSAFERRDLDALRALMNLTPGPVRELSAKVESRRAQPTMLSAVRVYADRRVVLDTSMGSLTLALRPDAAPATCYAFLALVEGGFYDGTSFHRVASENARGEPYLVQAGDPTGTGRGGAGTRLRFERSSLAHDFGVVSMARQPSDPDSASSQFFICLSRRACAGLDGAYTSFAQVAEGHDVLRAIAAVEVGPVAADDPASARERPLEPVVIERAYSVPAPAIDRAIRPAGDEEGAVLLSTDGPR